MVLRRNNGLDPWWALLMAVWLLCGFATFAFAQTQGSDRVVARQDTGVPVIRAQSKLVVVRVMVADKKAWRNGPSEAGQRCALATKATLFRLPATEPYIPTDCEGLFIRGLTAKDFHVFVDGVEQKIQSVTSESEGIRVRDNLGLHSEFSQTPVGRWSTTDGPIPRYFAADYGLLARNRYDLSFVPGRSDSTGCHEIKVKVDRRSSVVAARDQYCDGESPFDILNGSTFGNQLVRDLASVQPGEIPLSLQAAVFDRDNNDEGRVRIALEFPLNSLHRHWRQNWTLDANIGVLGMIYKRDGTLFSRFSDFGCCSPYATGTELGMGGTTVNRAIDLDKQSGRPPSVVSMALSLVEKGTLPIRYETSLDLTPGEYDLRIALGDGEKFGQAKTRLSVEKFDGKGLALSSVMLCKRFRDAHVAAMEAAASNFAPQYVPMMSNGIQFTPAGDTDFKPNDPLIPYFEIYAPQAIGKPTTGIHVQLRIFDAQSGLLLKGFPDVDADKYILPGSTTIPIAREVPISDLASGAYRLEVKVLDSDGRAITWKSANFRITDKQ